MMDDADNFGTDVVEEATTALRQAKDPGGPSPMLTQRTLAAVWAAEAKAQCAQGVRLRIAAGFLLCGAAIAIVVSLLHGRRSPAPDVRQIAVLPTTRPVETKTPEATTQSAEPDRVLAVVPPTPPGEVAITGHILFDGPTPMPRVIDVSAYPMVNGFVPGPIFDDSLQINPDRTLANVIVYISGPLPAGHQGDVPPPIVVHQRYCMIQPHVIAAMIGQRLILEDDDAMPHAIHSLNCATTPTFNAPVMSRATRTIDPFQATDTFQIGCEIHPWMRAWVRVFDHPYFDVTRSDGTFLIKDLPAGTYHLHAWHEVLGDQEKTITVNGGEPLSIDFTFASTQS